MDFSNSSHRKKIIRTFACSLARLLASLLVASFLHPPPTHTHTLHAHCVGVGGWDGIHSMQHIHIMDENNNNNITKCIISKRRRNHFYSFRKKESFLLLFFFGLFLRQEKWKEKERKYTIWFPLFFSFLLFSFKIQLKISISSM